MVLIPRFGIPVGLSGGEAGLAFVSVAGAFSSPCGVLGGAEGDHEPLSPRACAGRGLGTALVTEQDLGGPRSSVC